MDDLQGYPKLESAPGVATPRAAADIISPRRLDRPYTMVSLNLLLFPLVRSISVAKSKSRKRETKNEMWGTFDFLYDRYFDGIYNNTKGLGRGST